MTTKSAVKPTQAADYSHLEPLPDPPWEYEMMQSKPISKFQELLEPRFQGEDDVLIIGPAGYLCHARSDLNLAGATFVPDDIFVRGVADPDGIIATNGYVIGEVGKPPDLVFEVASSSTGRRDYTVKREGYARFGVPEYWRFDPSGGEHHGVALAGDRLVDGKYEPMEIHEQPDGLLWGYSPVLDLHVCSDDNQLRFRDPATMEFLLSNSEAQAELSESRSTLDMERNRRLSAEAEAARLREQLRRLQQG